MLGKLSSLQQIVAQLKEHNINNFAVTCLQAGYKTKRWAVGWSFQDYRPRNDVARHGDLVHAVLPPPTAHTIAAPLLSAEIAGERINAALKNLDVRWQWRPAIATGVMEARENVWSRAARRKKRFGLGDAEGGEVQGGESEDEDAVGIAVKVVCRVEAVEVRWLRGMDQILFQSICGLLKRALTGRD
jgi:23S rRNA (adenine1618-N6)-methyltransferase